MKKILSISLVLLILVLSSFPIFAEETSETSTLEVAETVLKTRYENYNFTLVEVCTVGDYKLYYNDTTAFEFTTREAVIGDYIATANARQTPYDLGLFVISDEKAFTFEEAYEAGIITDLDAVVQSAMSKRSTYPSGLCSYSFKKAPQEALLKTRYENSTFILAELGTFGEYGLYYNDLKILKSSAKETTLGNYVLKASETQLPYEFGLYVVSRDTAYTLEEAYEAGVITDMDAVYNMITANTELEYNFTIEKILPVVKIKKKTVKSGEKAKLFTVENAENITFTSANEKVAKVNNKGEVTGLKKGTAKITVTADGVKTTCNIKVTTDPQLTQKGKEVKAVQVKKNKIVKLKLTGKVKTIKNVYTNTKKAKITSGKNATVIKVKGLKKGTTTLKVKVNGVKTLKLKVKVK